MQEPNKNVLELELDDDGFLLDHTNWNKEVAIDISANEGIKELTGEHWRIIYFLRNYYTQFHNTPGISGICAATGFNIKQIYELFPEGLARGACKIAGLPKPVGCV